MIVTTKKARHYDSFSKTKQMNKQINNILKMAVVPGVFCGGQLLYTVSTPIFS